MPEMRCLDNVRVEFRLPWLGPNFGVEVQLKTKIVAKISAQFL